MIFNDNLVILAFVICIFMTRSPHISVVYSYIHRHIIHVFVSVMFKDADYFQLKSVSIVSCVNCSNCSSTECVTVNEIRSATVPSPK